MKQYDIYNYPKCLSTINIVFTPQGISVLLNNEDSVTIIVVNFLVAFSLLWLTWKYYNQDFNELITLWGTGKNLMALKNWIIA